jgi:hypothetical protein
MAQTKHSSRNRKVSRVRKPARVRPAAPAEATPEPEATALAVRTATPERAFAGRVRPPVPPAPPPAGRRAIFVDVENSSRAEHVGRVLDHLAIDRADRRVDLIAVGNWRVIGADTARLLARRGAQLVHSAPSTGVRDWSDLRIAVSAGVWLGSGRPGDLIEIISDDRAFDAVGDVAAVLGVEYRRLSYRGLTGLPAAEEAPAAEPQPAREGRRGGRGRRRGRGRGRPEHRGRGPAPHGAPGHPAPARPSEAARTHPETVAHTAPHDQLVDVVRELADDSPNGAVLIDTLARALKERGFSRPPGSPRLITRLRRIRELQVSRTGMITLTGAGGAAAPAEERPTEELPMAPGIDVDAAAEEEATPGNEAAPAPAAPRRSRRRRGRRRRGRGGRGGGAIAAAAPAPA